MNLNIVSLNAFKKDIKKLYKKYKKITTDLRILKETLLKNPKEGIVENPNRI